MSLEKDTKEQKSVEDSTLTLSEVAEILGAEKVETCEIGILPLLLGIIPPVFRRKKDDVAMEKK